MTQYFTIIDTQLWTLIGSKAEIAKLGTIITVTDDSYYVRERRMWKIVTAEYNGQAVAAFVGKYIEPFYLTEYTAPEPPPPDPTAPAEIAVAPHVEELQIGGVWVQYQHPGVVLRKVG